MRESGALLRERGGVLSEAGGVGVVALDVGGTGDVEGLDLYDPVRARTVEDGVWHRSGPKWTVSGPKWTVSGPK